MSGPGDIAPPDEGAVGSAVIHLVRHAAHDHVGRVLTGRAPGFGLGEAGRVQAGHLADWFSGLPVAAVETSPRERARETAQAIAAAVGVEPETVAEADEIDFGAWTLKPFEALDPDPEWRRWNEHRAAGCPPGGESMAAAKARITVHLARFAARLGGRTGVLVSHADVIKAAVAEVLGLSLDRIHRFEIAPASVTTIAAGSWGAKLLALNVTPAGGGAP
ncbi:histidine phosphatase family protein [Prosthecomicrobium sp. N25]|uniref:histidine phosphatase family protein n=1 Tax=Prosthecomicrobium sp. N25 TaxID=3129254 RepID=UPI003077D3FB